MTKPWTDDEVAALVRALREGATYSDCAAMFGRTIGAIAGCVRRYTQGKEALPVEPPPATFRVTLLALQHGQCKWPVADAPDLVGNYEFCGRHAHQGAVYCNHHRRLATTAPRTERRAA
jgi:hypothetical protein